MKRRVLRCPTKKSIETFRQKAIRLARKTPSSRTEAYRLAHRSVSAANFAERLRKENVAVYESGYTYLCERSADQLRLARDYYRRSSDISRRSKRG